MNYWLRQLAHLSVHVALACAAVRLCFAYEEYGLGVFCWLSQLIYEIVLGQTRRVARGLALMEFNEALHSRVDVAMDDWWRQRGETAAPEDTKGRTH